MKRYTNYSFLLLALLLLVACGGGKKSEKQGRSSEYVTNNEAIRLNNAGYELMMEFADQTDSVAKAYAMFQQAHKLDKQYELIYYNIAKAQILLKKYDEVAHTYDQIIALNTEMPDPYVYKGMFFDWREDSVQAKSYYNTALKLLEGGILNGKGNQLTDELSVCLVYFLLNDSTRLSLEYNRLTQKYAQDSINLEFVANMKAQTDSITKEELINGLFE